MLHAVIMAGGAGTRFWPLSRIALPKQLLHFGRGSTLLQEAVDRLAPTIVTENITVITNQQLVDSVKQQLPQLPIGAIIGEPAKRDTAPCIALASALIARQDPDATIIVMPSDHIITPANKFQKALRDAQKLVEQNPSSLVTFGITPTRPAETYGYIQIGKQFSSTSFEVHKFKEKPDAQTANQYLQEGGYYWNSGIFVWKAQAILNALRATRSDIMEHIDAIVEKHGQSDFDEVLEREFIAIKGTSIDYAVMEHYKPILMIDAPFQWDDIGSWQALSRLFPTDENNNTILSKHIGVETTGSIIHSSSNHLIATVGVNDLIIVHTSDATLVANKHDEESVRQLTDLLNDNGDQTYL